MFTGAAFLRLVWHAGKAKDWDEKPAAPKEGAQPAPEPRRPAWGREEPPAGDGLSLAERRRREFEAERKALQVTNPSRRQAQMTV